MIKYKLYKHQQEAVDLALQKGDFAFFHDMGSGKTLSAITLMRLLFTKTKRPMKTLILGPVAVVTNWKREIEKFSKIPSNIVYALNCNGAKRLKMLHEACQDNNIVIINYESLVSKQVAEQLLKWEPEIIIADESHLVKGVTSKRAKMLVQLADKSKHNFILTGTPILNSLIDIYMQFRIMDRGDTFGKNFFVFRSRYFYDTNSRWSGRPGYFPKWEPSSALFPEINRKIFDKAHRVMIQDCIDLPDRVVREDIVDMSYKQKILYKQMKENFIAYLDEVNTATGINKAIVANLAMVKALRLLQIASGILASDDGVSTIEDIPKLNRLKEILDELRGKKTIVWCSFVPNYNQIAKICDSLKLKYRFLTGQQTTKQKQESIDEFCSGEDINVLIANRRAGGTGINLKEAGYSIVFSRNFSLADELQSDARNYRSGSKDFHNKVIKINLITKGTIEEDVIEALKNKIDLSDKILNVARIIKKGDL
jgi:SNF2 family DNA or RNA helicase